MKKVYFTKENLPVEFQGSDLNSSSLKFSFRNGNAPFFVTEGKTIVDLIYEDERGKRITGKIIAPYDGVVEREHLSSDGVGTRSSRSINEGEVFFNFYSENEYVELLDTSFSIKEDEITGEKRICWKKINGKTVFFPMSNDSIGCYYVLMNDEASISLNLISGWPV